MNRSRFVHVLLPALLICLCPVLLLPFQSSAEMYVAGMVGYTSPNDLSNIKGTGGGSALSLSDLALQDSIAYGGKVGYYFPQIKWLGIETEPYNTTLTLSNNRLLSPGLASPFRQVRYQVLT